MQNNLPPVVSRKNPNWQDPGLLPEHLRKIRAANFALHVLFIQLPDADKEALKAAGFFKMHRRYLLRHTQDLLRALDRLDVMLLSGAVSMREFTGGDKGDGATVVQTLG